MFEDPEMLRYKNISSSYLPGNRSLIGDRRGRGTAEGIHFHELGRKMSNFRNLREAITIFLAARQKIMIAKITTTISLPHIKFCVFFLRYLRVSFSRAGDNMAAISRRKTGATANSASHIRCFIDNLFVPSVLLNLIIFR